MADEIGCPSQALPVDLYAAGTAATNLYLYQRGASVIPDDRPAEEPGFGSMCNESLIRTSPK